MDISIIVGLKNNLRYTQYFYKTLRAIYQDIEICFVSYGSFDGTHEWLDYISEKDDNVRIYYDNQTASLAQTYNKGVSLSTNKYVIFLHNDIVISLNFLENIIKYLDNNTVVSYTVVEPPVFDNPCVGKIINNFGNDIDNFNIDQFYKFCTIQQKKYFNQIEYGVSFFMALSKEVFEKLGGFDTLFDPMFAEDIDLIWRLESYNKTLITARDALCYHFVSKTSRFSEDYQNNTNEIEYRSNKNFIRKWGSTLKGPKYLTSIIIYNCTYEILELIEPWCNNLYIEKNLLDLYTNYLKEEQQYTKINLSSKLHTFVNSNSIKSDDSIVISCDANAINENNFSLLAKLPNMIKNNNKIGNFKLDIYTIYVRNLIDCRKYVV